LRRANPRPRGTTDGEYDEETEDAAKAQQWAVKPLMMMMMMMMMILYF
jgi:hypothetical protein